MTPSQVMFYFVAAVAVVVMLSLVGLTLAEQSNVPRWEHFSSIN